MFCSSRRTTQAGCRPARRIERDLFLRMRFPQNLSRVHTLWVQRRNANYRPQGCGHFSTPVTISTWKLCLPHMILEEMLTHFEEI